MKYIQFLFGLILAFGAYADGTVTIKSVTAQQRYPWNGLVDIAVTMDVSADQLPYVQCYFVATNSSNKAALSVRHVTRAATEDTGSGTLWTRRFVWDAAADASPEGVDNIELTAGVEVVRGVQLWENGPFWAECNVGANRAEDVGYYFWRGDTVGYKRVGNQWNASDGSESGYSFDNEHCPISGKDHYALRWNLGYIDDGNNLVPAYDAASVHMGLPWRMPTKVEMSALFANCTTIWTNRNGVYGRLIAGKGLYASKCIFLPASGCGYEGDLEGFGSEGNYGSSTLSGSEMISLYLSQNYFGASIYADGDGRFIGMSVRGIRGSNDHVLQSSGTVRLSIASWATDDMVRVKSVTAQQRYPWNGLVDIVVTMDVAAERIDKVDCAFKAINSASKTALSMNHIRCIGTDTGGGTTWMRRFVWDAAADVGAVQIGDVELAVDAKILGGVQLWENGPFWAECNIGSDMPESSGSYFWWGGSEGYMRDGDVWKSVDGMSCDFSFSDGNCPTHNKSHNELSALGYADENGVLDSAHDAAASLGAPWRMPTRDEFSALIENCTSTWIMRNGVYGRLLTGKGTYASRSIFLPAAGMGRAAGLDDYNSYGSYWASLANAGDSGRAWGLLFSSTELRVNSFYFRYLGLNVRPIRGFKDYGNVSSETVTHLKLDCRTGVRQYAANCGVMRYDVSWYEGCTLIRVFDGDAQIAAGSAGTLAWCPEKTGEYTLKLEALNDLGDVIASETTEFNLGYIRNVTARQLWPHKKVEVCYEAAEDICELLSLT